MDIRKIAAGTTLFALLACAGAWAFAQPADDGEKGDDEQVITLDTAPESIRAAAIKHAGEAKNITKVLKEQDDDDAVIYEVEYNAGSGAAAIKCSAVFSSAGDLMEIEKATTMEKLPAAVMAALKKKYPTATFTDPQFVTRMFYEIDLVIEGKEHEVRVDASGDIDDESQGDDEHAGKADHDDGVKKAGKDDDDEEEDDND